MFQNIKYNIREYGENTLLEAELTGPVRNDDWIEFINHVAAQAESTQRLFLLIEEKGFESEINYETAKKILGRASDVSFKEIIVSFSTSDPFKIQIAKLFGIMSRVAKVPLVISYHQTTHEARNAIKNFCAHCFKTS